METELRNQAGCEYHPHVNTIWCRVTGPGWVRERRGVTERGRGSRKAGMHLVVWFVACHVIIINSARLPGPSSRHRRVVNKEAGNALIVAFIARRLIVVTPQAPCPPPCLALVTLPCQWRLVTLSHCRERGGNARSTSCRRRSSPSTSSHLPITWRLVTSLA